MRGKYANKKGHKAIGLPESNSPKTMESPASLSSSPASRTLSQKAWTFVEGPLFWGFIAVVLVIVGTALGITLLFVIAWVAGSAAVYRAAFFEASRKTVFFGNVLASIGIAVGLGLLWWLLPRTVEITADKSPLTQPTPAVTKPTQPPRSTAPKSQSSNAAEVRALLEEAMQARKLNFEVDDFSVEWDLHVPHIVIRALKKQPRKNQDADVALNKALCNGPAGFELLLPLIPGQMPGFTNAKLMLQVVGKSLHGQCSIATYLEGTDDGGTRHQVEVQNVIGKVTEGSITFLTRIFQYRTFMNNWKLPRYKLADFGKPIATPDIANEIDYGHFSYDISQPPSPKQLHRMQNTAPTSIDVTVWPNPHQGEQFNSHWLLWASTPAIRFGVVEPTFTYRLMREPPS